MTYAEAVSHLNALMPELAGSGSSAMRPRPFDLAHMRRLCEALGNPQSRVPAVLVAGTNGKGSTAATLASILTAAGYRAGLYTSPHLVRVNERIQLGHPVLPSEYGSASTHGTDGQIALREIPDGRFAELYTRVDAAGQELVRSGLLPRLPSFFERLTAVAFLFYAESNAEIAVLEVGLGGRLDATNVVEPILSILTDIALDHQEYLGHTIAAITAEKCGILRKGGTLVTLPQHAEANQAIGEAAMRLGVHGISATPFLPNAGRGADSDWSPPAMPESPGSDAVSVSHAVDRSLVDPPSQGQHLRDEPHYHPRQGQPSPGIVPEPTRPVTFPALNRYVLTPEGEPPFALETPLAGDHQRRNVALAIAATLALRDRNGYSLDHEAIVRGVRETHWPGRLEAILPNVLLDVAHNPAGAWTLRSALASLPEAQPRTLLFSCLRDKDLGEMSRILLPLFDSAGSDPLRRHDHVILAPITSPRAAAVEDLLEAAHRLGVPAHAAPHVAAALGQARQITPPGGLIVVTGSVYLVGEVRQLLLAGQARR